MPETARRRSVALLTGYGNTANPDVVAALIFRRWLLSDSAWE